MAKNKEKESTIGKIIYGFLMFAPLLAILTSCAYTIFNQNAKETNNIEYYEYQTNEVDIDSQDPKSQIITGNVYKVNLNDSGFTTSTGTAIDIKACYVKINDIMINCNEFQEYKLQAFRYNAQVNNILFTVLAYIDKESNKTTPVGGFANQNQIAQELYIVPNENTDRVLLTSSHILSISDKTKFNIKNITQDKAVNNIYYAMNQIEQEPVFNWAKNNDIYTGIKEVCDTLSITNTFYPMILTYWLIISTIYFIYDIILIIFHILHNNIHKLEDI